jgi:transposase-like protein
MKAPVGILKPFKRRVPDKKIADIYTMIQQGLTVREASKFAGIPQPGIVRMLRGECYQNLRRA